MAKLKEKIIIKIPKERIKVRSPFATMRMTGAGPHKSEKDYNRQKQKLETKKLSHEYE